MSSPPRFSYWCPRSGASSGMPAPSRSETASASAPWTSGLAVFRPLGVWTGSSAENCVVQIVSLPTRSPPCRPVGSAVNSFRSCETNRLNRIAPFESRSSCRFHALSGSHAPLTFTGPDDPIRNPPGADSHIETTLSRHSSPAYWRLPTAIRWSSLRLKRLPGRPSLPASRSSTWTSPSRVRSVRSAFSIPMMRSKPVSGSSGLESQWLSFPFVT